ncbi:hypothetical protein [Herbidospora sp. RD11066]
MATAQGPSAVEVRGGALLDGRFLSGATLHLVTPQVHDAFLEVFRSVGASVPSTVGTSVPVTVRGLAKGTADCVLGANSVEFQASDSQQVLPPTTWPIPSCA